MAILDVISRVHLVSFVIVIPKELKLFVTSTVVIIVPKMYLGMSFPLLQPVSPGLPFWLNLFGSI
jgi:hypothetical protein